MHPIPEVFLHFIWRTLRFDVTELTTTAGDSLQLIHPGRWNHDQGPDFLDGKINIGLATWSGHIELHIHGKEWYTHKHHLDPYYNNVILHVVLYASEKPVLRQDGSEIPELVLNSRISPHLFEAYQDLMEPSISIPCATQIAKVNPFYINRWLERLAIERVATKAARLKTQIDTINDWDQLIWQELAAMMGGPVNKEAFKKLAQLIPYKWMMGYRKKTLWLEALLFGAAGLLDQNLSDDPYVDELIVIWQFLQKKHAIATESRIAIRFSRMRPAAMPTIRLSQLIALVQKWPRLTQLLLPEGSGLFYDASIDASNYWDSHYTLERIRRGRKKRWGNLKKTF